MICPTCFSEERKSIVREEFSRMTLMTVDIYYDENGLRHVHDPNVTTTHYRCSNGHVWPENTKQDTCWCGK